MPVKILYKKPKLELISSREIDPQSGDYLSFIFKLDFLPCEEFINVILDVEATAIFGEDFTILNKDLSIRDSNELKQIEFLFNNTDEYIIKILPYNKYQSESKYIRFYPRLSPLYENKREYVEGTIKASSFITINTFDTDSEYSPQEGESFEPQDIDLSISNLIDYSPESIPYSYVLDNDHPPEIGFEVSVLTENYDNILNKNINIIRSSDELNSLIRIDTTVKSFGQYFIYPQYKYIHFFAGESNKTISISKIIGEIPESLEQIKFNLTSIDNAIITNEELTLEVTNV